MRVYKRKGWRLILPAFIAASLFSYAVHATLIDNGTTNYHEQWQGDYLDGYINWWVYDNHEDFEGDSGFDVPGTGEFVYVYQIFNDLLSAHDVAFFSILDLDESNVTGQMAGDGGSGVQPVDDGYLDPTDGSVWEWSLGSFGLIGQDDHSWYLILSSDYGPVTRDFKIEGPDDELKGPGDVPEPSLVALFGLGGAALLRRRKK